MVFLGTLEVQGKTSSSEGGRTAAHGAETPRKRSRPEEDGWPPERGRIGSQPRGAHGGVGPGASQQEFPPEGKRSSVPCSSHLSVQPYAPRLPKAWGLQGARARGTGAENQPWASSPEACASTLLPM